MSSLGTKIPSPAKPKFAERGSTYSPSGQLRVIVNRVTPVSTPCFLYLGSLPFQDMDLLLNQAAASGW